MEFLVFQLQAPLSSWGDTAVGEYRGSYEHPGESALIGLLGAALGTRREDEAAHAALLQGYGFAVGVQSSGKLLRDYHTAQVPGRAALKGRPHATRRDELSVPKDALNTILSTRDYRQGAACLVAIQPRGDVPHSLETLADKLHKPQFVLYLGRKSCPPGVPLYPQIVTADSVRAAFDDYVARIEVRREEQKDRKGRLPLEPVSQVTRLMWGDGVEAGVSPDLSTPRKDRLIRRRGWQFGDRIEHVALIQTGD